MSRALLIAAGLLVAATGAVMTEATLRVGDRKGKA
jgi:hypothetical protein